MLRGLALLPVGTGLGVSEIMELSLPQNFWEKAKSVAPDTHY